LESQWEKTKTDLKTINWKGDTIYLKNVSAIKNKQTGTICFYPSEVAKAEINLLAEKNGLEPRDVPLLLMLFAKPGPFQEGQVPYKYHLNKMLFYQWKGMQKQGLDETFAHDVFEAAPRGPIPKNLGEDLKRLEKKGLVLLCYKKWGKGEKEGSLLISLTRDGTRIAASLASEVQEPLKEVTVEVKHQLFPLDPRQIQQKVHKEFPEFRKIYSDLDKE